MKPTDIIFSESTGKAYVVVWVSPAESIFGEPVRGYQGVDAPPHLLAPSRFTLVFCALLVAKWWLLKGVRRLYSELTYVPSLPYYPKRRK